MQSDTCTQSVATDVTGYFPIHSMLLTHYLYQYGLECELKAVLAVSCPWNSHKTRDSLELNRVNRLYTKHLAGVIKELMKK